MSKDYSKSKIYKIEPICEHDEGDIYIGSTINDYLSIRMGQHRRNYKHYKGGKGHKVNSFIIFDKYDVENCQIILIEKYPCTCKEELHAREAYYIKNTRCVNKYIPGRTDLQYYHDNKDLIKEKKKESYNNKKDLILEKNKEYREKNKDLINEKHREYYNNNKDLINEKRREPTACECGCVVQRGELSQHRKTKKHLNLMDSKNL